MHRFRSHNDRTGMFRGHIMFGLPENPWCWLFGHTARVTIVEPTYSDPYRVIRCLVCDRRHVDHPLEQAAVADYMEQGMTRRDAAKKLTASQVEVARRDPKMVAAGIDPRGHGWTSRDNESVNVEAVYYPQYWGERWRWGRFVDNLGFRLHTGGRSSETPVDASVHFGVGSVYLSTSMFGRLTEVLGRGHKRELSLRTHSGSLLWWKVWYDDDGGNDAYHRCDSWRAPKVWPWSAGRRKARSWMCLRDGNIDLNPATALWGSPKFHYEPVGEQLTAFVTPAQFPGDTYLVGFQLMRQVRFREHGPAWARRVLSDEFTVKWDTQGHCNGIPVRNDSWKGDEVLAAGVSLPEGVGPDDAWLQYAVAAVVEQIEKDRRHFGYTPPKPALP